MEEYEAGPELDAEVAEKVMGWTLVFRRADDLPCFRVGTDERFTLISASDFRPSTDIKAAWEVVEKMKHAHISLTIRPYSMLPEQGYRVAIEPMGGPEVGYEVADTAPLAICLAALKAVEAKD